jgi:hypothetical protein
MTGELQLLPRVLADAAVRAGDGCGGHGDRSRRQRAARALAAARAHDNSGGSFPHGSVPTPSARQHVCSPPSSTSAPLSWEPSSRQAPSVTVLWISRTIRRR